MMLTAAAAVAHPLSEAHPLSVVSKRQELTGNRPIFEHEVNLLWIPVLDEA